MEIAKTTKRDHSIDDNAVWKTSTLDDISSDHDDIFSNHRNLVKWTLKNNGYLHPDVRIAFNEMKGYHMVVAEKKSIPTKTRIATCPMTGTLSVLNALDIAPFQSHGSRLPQSFLDENHESPELIQTFFLMQQLVLSDKSWWASYIRTLPTISDVNAMQFESEHDRLWIEGTNLKSGVDDRTQKWRSMFDKGMKQLKNASWPNAVNDVYTWEMFRWAATIYGSRSFTSQVLDETLPADKARPSGSQEADHSTLAKLFGDGFAVLLPLVDILNHKPAVPVEWQARYSHVGLQVLQSYESGQELCNNYGPRDNEGLLLAYGFTIEGNPFDHVVIKIRVPPGSPLAEAQNWKKDPRSDENNQCYLFNVEHPCAEAASSLEMSVFSYNLLNSLSVLVANDRELQEMFTKQKTLMSNFDSPTRTEDCRNLLGTLGQLLKDCEAKAKRLRLTNPSNGDSQRIPVSQKLQFVKRYRDSQLSIYETAIAVCRFTLARAVRDGEVGQCLEALKTQISSETVQNVEMLIDRHPSFTRPNLLFTVQTLLHELPISVSDLVQKCITNMQAESELSSISVPIANTHILETKTQLAITLAVLFVERSQGASLSPRIAKWTKQLSGWYPHDEYWAFVPDSEQLDDVHPGLVTLLNSYSTLISRKSVDEQLKMCLSPKQLCWGWNVMEEEGIFVPSDLLVSTNRDGITNPDGMEYLLYCMD